MLWHTVVSKVTSTALTTCSGKTIACIIARRNEGAVLQQCYKPVHKAVTKVNTRLFHLVYNFILLRQRM